MAKYDTTLNHPTQFLNPTGLFEDAVEKYNIPNENRKRIFRGC